MPYTIRRFSARNEPRPRKKIRLPQPQTRRADRLRDATARTPHLHALEARARLYAASKGVPFTPMRQRALAVLGTSNKALTLSEIVEEIKVHRVQVYRLVEFLQEAGCIHRLASRPLYFVCEHLHRKEEAIVFMVCRECGKVHETTSETVTRELRGAAKTKGFRVQDPTIEVEGECAKCASARVV
jgi:Fur family zinc uptake transcriptional regulator